MNNIGSLYRARQAVGPTERIRRGDGLSRPLFTDPKVL